MIDILTDRHTGETFLTDDHQHEAYAHLMKHKRAALFLGMSLSKTAISLSYLYEMHYREGAISRTLVIAPDKVARVTWPDEINKWAHLEGMRYSVVAGDEKQRLKALSADAELFIIGVDNVSWLTAQYIKKSSGKWVGVFPFCLVLIDELSLFKSRGSGRFKDLKRAIKTVEYRIGMTGTPAPNGYIDLWAEIMLLDDGERLGDTFGQYFDKYFTSRGNGQIVYEYIPRPGAVNVIAKKIQDIALTMKTEDKIVLPPLYTENIEIQFSAFDREVYDTLEAEYCLAFFEGDSEVTVKTAADLTNKLLQVSSGAIYEDRLDATGPRVWHELNTVKLEALRELLDKFPNDNIIVVYQYKHEVARIQAAFDYARVLRKKDKAIEDVRDWNAGKIRMLLLHPASAGHGLNLQFGGRRMVWFSQTWNLEHYLQTVRRLLRRGITKPVYNYRLIVKGTRDLKVCARVNSKDNDQNFLLNEIKELRRKYGNVRKQQ